MSYQIFIVEDHAAVRSAYVSLIQHDPELQVSGAVASGEEALKLIPKQQTDLVIVDMRLPGMNGLTFIAHLYQLRPAVPVIIVSSFKPVLAEPIYNIKSFIYKQDAAQLLVPEIRRILTL